MAITSSLHPLSKDVAEQLREQIRRMLVRLDEIGALASGPSAWMPPVDLCELEDAILVRVEMPGVSIDHVRVSFLDNVLKIDGRKERVTPTGRLLPESERPIRFICLERSYGNFSLGISLKWPIDPQKIEAKMAHGILQIRLPKSQNCGHEVKIPITE
jgi:HSP20 family protein